MNFTGFREKAARKAPRIVELEPNAFADTWEDKPDCAMDVGLRLVSEMELNQARSEAARKAWRAHPNPDDEDDRIDCFNDAIMVEALACAVCQPDNCREPIWEAQDDVLARALTRDGIRLLWDELELLMAVAAPGVREASDEEIVAVASRLSSGEAIASGDVRKNREVRRLVGRIVTLIG